MKKTLIFLMAAVMVCFFVTSAMAFQVVNRSAEMTENSPCDQAGTIKMTFELTDWSTIKAYLQSNQYAEIRITLTGTDLELDQDKPFLCKDIKAHDFATGVPHTGELVTLDTTNPAPADAWEISDIDGDTVPDFTAYVWGEAGDPVGQIIHVYITEIPENLNPDFSANPPWFRIGLWQELLDEDDDPTAICANVIDFEQFNKLTISNESIPQGLQFTGDNEIGHFNPQVIDLRECDKNEGEGCNSVSEIQLCSLDAGGENQGPCPVYYECFVYEGAYPEDGEFEMSVSTDTPGVYIAGISVSSYSGSVSWKYFECADDTGCGCDTTCPEVRHPGNCNWKAKCAMAKNLDLSHVVNGKLVFCVAYNVNPDEAVAGNAVMFDACASTIPCGTLFSDTYVGATLVPCKGTETSMYFPYVLTGASPWSTGIVVTNLSSDFVPAEDMEVTFVLTDANGDTYTKVMDSFDSVVWSANLDTLLTDFGWNPAPGNAWLDVTGNFIIDGYCYHSNGVFGAGTLPRLEYKRSVPLIK